MVTIYHKHIYYSLLAVSIPVVLYGQNTAVSVGFGFRTAIVKPNTLSFPSFNPPTYIARAGYDVGLSSKIVADRLRIEPELKYAVNSAQRTNILLDSTYYRGIIRNQVAELTLPFVETVTPTGVVKLRLLFGPFAQIKFTSATISTVRDQTGKVKSQAKESSFQVPQKSRLSFGVTVGASVLVSRYEGRVSYQYSRDILASQYTTLRTLVKESKAAI